MSGMSALCAKVGVGVAGAALAVTGLTAATTATASTAAPPANVAVQVTNGHLADQTGRSLYLFVADTAGTSTCVDACAAQWPPLTTGGAVTAGSGVDAAKLKTSVRQDGTKQATYNNHPLYFFSGDTGPIQTNGQGVNAFGALWWLVDPNGDAITTGGSPGTTSPPGTTTA
jgi:predicted lipoprotein with Yx(FWY)xxD motif